MSCLLTVAHAATPLQDLTYKNSLYYLDNELYTGDVSLETSNGKKLVYDTKVKDGKLVHIYRDSVLEFTGSIKNGKRDGEWVTTYPLGSNDIKIVERYDNDTLKSINVYRRTTREQMLQASIEGKRKNQDNRWQWKVYSRNSDRTITYTGETIGVMPKGKATSFFSDDGQNYTDLEYIDKTKANLKLQIFHIILHETNFREESYGLTEGPDKLIRDGRWNVTYKSNTLPYAKDYIYGRDPSTYSAKLEHYEDGTSEFTGSWRQEDDPTGYEMTIHESTLYDKQGNITYHKIIDPKNSIKRNEKYYPNGNIQYTNLMISDKYVVLLEYYPTGELFKQSIFPAQKDLDHYTGEINPYRQKVGESLFYSQEGDLVNPKNQSTLSIFNNPKRLNQKSVRELFHEPK